MAGEKVTKNESAGPATCPAGPQQRLAELRCEYSLPVSTFCLGLGVHPDDRAYCSMLLRAPTLPSPAQGGPSSGGRECPRKKEPSVSGTQPQPCRDSPTQAPSSRCGRGRDQLGCRITLSATDPSPLLYLLLVSAE